MVRFHHVNLGVPVGGIDAEAAFLVGILSCRPLEAPAELRSVAHWFETDDGKQIHLSEDVEHRAAALAHVAVDVDDVVGLEQVLEQAGYQFRSSDGAGQRIVFCRDPAGNNWQLRGAAFTGG